MPLHATPYPHVMNSLAGPSAPKSTYLVFFSDVEDGQMWCPDCRRVDQLVKDTFDGDDKPKAIIYWVGKKAEWKNRPENHARVDWNVNEVPTILKIQDGKEVARLVDSEIDEGDKLKTFVSDQ